MATTSDLRRGMLIMYNGAIHRVVEYQHIAPGNWRAMMRMKLKNFENGKIVEDRVRAGSEIEVITTESHDAQYLYKDASGYHFMDMENFETITLAEETVAEQMAYVKENDNVSLLLRDTGQVLDVEVPNFVALAVTAADVAVRGDTATNLMKNVTLETGMVIQAPAFVKEGDVLRIDTRSGEYVERVNK
jgi:elongation factor P